MYSTQAGQKNPAGGNPLQDRMRITIEPMYNYRSHPKKRFDFELGYLVQSPCKACVYRHTIPDCIDRCRILDRVQTTLARSVVTTCGFSPLEPYSVRLEERQKK
jgi:hypothetical protein